MGTPTIDDDVVTPIDRYLAEQQDVTAVERFARRHEADLLDPQDRWYADRLPTEAPGVGEQYAFRVDLDQCTGCQACVAACHRLNGLDEGESWRTVGQLVGTGPDPHRQTVPSGCHHCIEPACLSGCPTNAYEKDPWTGIVRHLDDQCFGCGYCELTCPYEVPKLNARLGVVRKCDLCADRLAEGEAPACVQACPTSAITIDVVDVQEIVASTQTGSLVPGAPESRITAPTTRYVSQRPVPDDVRAVDHHAVHPSSAHPPLAAMLVLSQLSVGTLASTLMASWFRGGEVAAAGTVGAAIAGVVAMLASVTHLGRPLVAWRAVLGIGHSWLSREIVAFGSYVALVWATALLQWSGATASLVRAVGALTALAGIAGVACSVQLYVVTRRTWWAPRFTGPKFGGTAVVAGPLLLATGLLTVPGHPDARSVVPVAIGVSAVAAVAKLVAEAGLLSGFGSGSVGGDGDGDLDRTRRLLRGPLATSSRWRFGLGTLGLVVSLAVVPTRHVGVAVLALVLTVAAELVERYQFFTASVAPRMPGGFRR